MRWLIISGDFLDMRGGVAGYAYHLSQALAKENEVFVLTSADPSVRTDGNAKILPGIPRWNFGSIARILKTVDEADPDVVSLQYVSYMYHRRGVPIAMALLGIMLKLRGFKLITTFHEVARRFPLGKPWHWIDIFFERVISWILAFCSHKVIVTVPYWKRLLFPFSARIAQVPVGSNILPVPVSSEELSVVRIKIAPKGEKIIAVFGVAGPPVQRVDLLISALSMLPKQLSRGVKLLLFGFQGNATVKRCVEESNRKEDIVITGFLKEDEVFKHLRDSDLFVSLEGGAYGGVNSKSTSLAAAFAAGLPILGNKGILTDVFFRHLENVYLINSLSVGEISSAISELLRWPELLNKLAAGSKESYDQNLTWEKIARRYDEIAG